MRLYGLQEFNMPFVYTTLSNPQRYAEWSKGDCPEILRSVAIKGGANVVRERKTGQQGTPFYTPSVVETEISANDADFLKSNFLFKTHEKNGFVKIETKKLALSKAAIGLKTSDKSAQINSSHYKSVTTNSLGQKIIKPHGDIIHV